MHSSIVRLYPFTISDIIIMLLYQLKMIDSIPKKKSAFCLKTSYFMNKYEPPRRQLCQCSRLAHNRLQSFSISVFWPKPG